MTSMARKASNEEAVPPPVLNDCTPAEAADQRYLEACAKLYVEADEQGHIAELADNLAWTLAHVAVNCGAGAAGDILRTLGTYMCRLEARKQAAIEAARAKEEGRLPN